MGSEDKADLEKQVEDKEEKVMESERTQKDMFFIICQRLIGIVTEHLSTCDQEGVDYETTWFFSTVDHFRQILFKVWEVWVESVYERGMFQPCLLCKSV